jgi:hypothetical protein
VQHEGAEEGVEAAEGGRTEAAAAEEEEEAQALLYTLITHKAYAHLACALA